MRGLIKLVIVLIAVITFFYSCNIEKRLYMPGYNLTTQKQTINKENNVQDFNSYAFGNRKNNFLNKNEKVEEVFNEISELSIKPGSLNGSNTPMSLKSNITTSDKKIKRVNNYLKIKDSCDNIILRNGTEIWAKEVELGATEITYKKCELENGPRLTIPTSSVLIIKYANGSIDVLASETPPSNEFIQEEKKPEKEKRKVLGSAVGSFIFSIIGFIIFGIPLGITAVICGIIGLNKINKNPNKYMGSGFAIAGIIIGFIDIVAVLIILSMM